MGEEQEPSSEEPSTESSPTPPPPDGEEGERGPAAVFDELPPEVEYPMRPGEKRLEGWRKRSAVGAMFTGLALGMREVLEPDRNEPAIVMETSGVPPKDLPVEADIDQVPPKQSVVKIRPWLLGDAALHEDADEGQGEGRQASRPSSMGQATAGRPAAPEPVRPRSVTAPGAPRKR
jgi:hypothetical protein